MQNKPNLLNTQMNVSPVKTMNYEQLTMNYANKNKPNTNPIQSQSKPIKANQSQYKPNQSQYKPKTNPISEKPKMKLNSYSTKDYENKPRLRTPGKQTQSNPISKGTIAQSRRLLTESGQVELNYSGVFSVYQSALRFLWLIRICRSLMSITPLVLISPSG
jgi:hypothetical protein